MDYLKNSIIKFDNLTIDDVSKILSYKSGSINIPLYDVTKINKIRNYIKTIPSNYFKSIKIKNNVCLEKISYDLYQSPNYWDIILLVNYRNPLFGMPYDFDVISGSADYDVQRYETKILKRQLSPKLKEAFRKRCLERLSNENEEFRIIKYILAPKIFDFLQGIYELNLDS